jgi:hypothetical protein
MEADGIGDSWSVRRSPGQRDLEREAVRDDAVD